jgi:hypothetical protein
MAEIDHLKEKPPHMMDASFSMVVFSAACIALGIACRLFLPDASILQIIESL